MQPDSAKHSVNKDENGVAWESSDMHITFNCAIRRKETVWEIQE
jgi:hypothetical protein